MLNASDSEKEEKGGLKSESLVELIGTCKKHEDKSTQQHLEQ